MGLDQNPQPQNFLEFATGAKAQHLLKKEIIEIETNLPIQLLHFCSNIPTPQRPPPHFRKQSSSLNRPNPPNSSISVYGAQSSAVLYGYHGCSSKLTRRGRWVDYSYKTTGALEPESRRELGRVAKVEF
jgi:hypothetical protein